jgi:AcrR family transcriptional regulator
MGRDNARRMTFSTAALPTTGPVDDRPERLIAAARELANETGSAAFTVAQVAARARLSLKSFYRCFGGKDDLLIALLGEESRVGAALLEQLLEGRTDQLRAFVDELFALATFPGKVGYAGVLVREHRRLVEYQPDAIRTALAPLTDVLASRITSADPARDAQTVFGVLMAGLHDVVLGRVADVPEYAAYLYRFCAHGLDGSA